MKTTTTTRSIDAARGFDSRLDPGHAEGPTARSPQIFTWSAACWIALLSFGGGLVFGGNMASANVAAKSVAAQASAPVDEIPNTGWVATEARLRQTIVGLTGELAAVHRKKDTRMSATVDGD